MRLHRAPGASSVKAQELNSTHLGQAISITLAEASLTDVLAEITHQADLIDDRKMDGVEKWVQGRRHTHLRFMRLGSISIEPESVVVFHGKAPSPHSGTHYLTEDHNTDPVCACGWGPEYMWPKEKPATRADGREMVRRHVRAQPTG
jgi:hypothetical protein